VAQPGHKAVETGTPRGEDSGGRQCFQFLADTMQNVRASDIQCDEVWSYVGCKQKTAFLQNAGEGCGDAYVFTAIDRNTNGKLRLRNCHLLLGGS
jgi:hypothetical protein